MGFKMPAIMAVVGMVCAAVALIFQIVGVATTGWITATVNLGIASIDQESGLWKSCVNDVCADIDGLDWLDACKAFGIIGLLVLVGCVAVGVLMCFKENDQFPMVAAVLGFVAGFCILIEFAVYAGKTEGDFTYGYSFALTIVACALAVVAGVCFFLSKNKA